MSKNKTGFTEVELPPVEQEKSHEIKKYPPQLGTPLLSFVTMYFVCAAMVAAVLGVTWLVGYLASLGV